MQQVTAFWRGFGLRRLITHLVLALLSAGACWAAHLYVPRAEAAFVFMLGFGYSSILFIAATLVIGPLNLLRQRRNPVNINLRRDTGIWAAITGCLHVVFAFRLHMQGQVLFYFFEPTDEGLRPLLNRFGIGNTIGAAATVILIALLLTSNTLSLRKLKGRRWKTLQRFNYALAVLALIHTLLFQGSSPRAPFFMDALLITVVIVLAAQSMGIHLISRRRGRLTAAPLKTNRKTTRY